MEAIKENILSRIIRHAIVTILCISAVICLGVSFNYRQFYWASLMPVVALIVFIICKTNKKAFDNISLIVINVSMALRYGLYPALLMLSGEKGLYYADDTETVLLMLYELLGIFAVISLKGKQLICIDDAEKDNAGSRILKFAI